MRKWFIGFLWTLLVLIVIGTAVCFWAISEGKIGYMPPIEDLQNPINRYATQVYSADGKLMGTWSMSRENRVMVGYSEIAPSLIEALVATEDERFYEHSGIDFYALGRAIVKRGLMGQKNAGGGSTITQQLAKQLFSETAYSTLERALQKPIEWVIAVKLERNYTKDEIIAMYLNYFDFLHNAVGIKTAANTYFSKEPSELTVTESATLVGLCKNPSYFNPVRYPDRSLERRNVVLGQMLKAGYLSQEEYDSCRQEPLNLKFHVADHNDGEATYFRDFLRRYMMAKKPKKADYPEWNYVKYYMDSLYWEQDPLYGWCNKNVKRDGEHYNIYTDGLKVYTTIDSRMQHYAEQACYEHVVGYLQPEFDKGNKSKPNAPYSRNLSQAEVQRILQRNVRQSERYRVMKNNGSSEEEITRAFATPVPMTIFTYHGEVDTTMTPMDSIRYYKSFLRTGFFSIEPQTGAVKAYVGGLDFQHFAYDMATEGRRQVGSTIKPFLYSLAMENGMTPCDEVPNVQETYIVNGRPWTPRNGSRARYGEMVTLKWGLQQSNNWISAYLMMHRLTPEGFVTLLHNYGIRNPEIVPSPALCLGPCEITVAEMASAYTAFINHGIRTAPMYVSKIVDNEGNTLAEFKPRMNEVISGEAADKMLYMLRAVVDGGTASRLRYRYNITAPLGGKTGTTNSNSDGWFMGVAPKLVSACWVGGDDRDIHFDSMVYGQGASMALPIFGLYMKRVYADETLPYSQEDQFDLPSGFDPCHSDDDMQIVDGPPDSADEIIEQIFE
ncbi:transglycosylase domain-containing protein [Prevotella sp. E2-28]|uniref:transglycosylase domain-containing protein n=1 Tax=Prevotella sp. E2-28 TaxID=2913620 RepID=UPI001EDA6659|nr:transglycosylase domain-containing protein [Prevotella sp. E2-28]UKK54701.1 transglycosylase domain-containing protein [Prevotella sp. E2-28]